MRPIVTPAQMRALDNRTIEELGLPGIVLMELAARGIMLEIEALTHGQLDGLRALVFCGPGNNGGDGFAVARRLLNHGCNTKVFLCAPREKVTGDALTNLTIFEKLGGTIIEVKKSSQLNNLPMADIIVDALLGTGMEGKPRGVIASAIDAINDHNAEVISVDIASGVNGATGAVEGEAVRASITATFGEIKVGHLIPPGLNFAGRIGRVDIQIPPAYVREANIDLYLVEPEDIFAMLPMRQRDSHKGDNGKVLVVAGSVGMTGAAELTAKACLRAGAGMVKVATAKSAQAIIAGHSSEVMTIPVEDTETGSIAPEAETTIREARNWADVEVIGPGLSMNEETVRWFAEHVKELPLPTVIDADGLNSMAEAEETFKNLNPGVVLTPHIGELARLTGLSIKELESNRVEYVRQFAIKWNVTLVLKGVPTIVASPEGPAFAVLTGNPGMGTAGMGDVLTGTIAGLLAQGVGPVEAALSGTTIHGLAGNLAADELGSQGLVAGDIIDRLPLAQDILAGRAAYPGHQHGGCGCGSGGCGGGNGGGGCDGDCDCGGDCNCG
ncbi:NAD(P)H-hydrate dehydratase [bacterium]|nr:NAD(P)H-hydrate dehydratase [bacterium]